MAFNGAGVYTRLYSFVQDRINGIKINSSRMDGELDGIAAGLSNCITKDGQTTLTADIPFNGRKITGLGNAAAGTDALNRDTADGRYVQSNAGTVLDSSMARYTTFSTVTATIPLDDTIPQNTEGTQILSVTITPKTTTNKVRIRFKAVGTLNAAGTLIASVFANSGANAVATAAVTLNAGGQFGIASGEVEITPAATTTQTYTLRVGLAQATSLYVNGASGARFFGGATGCELVVEEIKA